MPLLDRAFRARKHRVGGSWRTDKTYVRIRGQWTYLHRAVDKAGNTVNFLLTAKRDSKAAVRFLYKAIGQHGAPAKITIDKSTATTAAIENYNSKHDTKIELSQVKYPNTVVDQDHRAIKRKVHSMNGFKSFWSDAVTLAGIELMHIIRKVQLKATGRLGPAQQLYSLAT
jgi:putative transposase